MKFYSQFGFHDPDAKAYEAQKKLRVITIASENLYMGIPSLPPMLLGNGALKSLWAEYYGLRLAAAVHGIRKPYLTRFPGHIVPGSGAGANSRYTGSLAIERFEHLLLLGGGLPPLGPFADRYAKLEHCITESSQLDWPWRDRITPPRLKILTPHKSEQISTQEQRRELLYWLREEVERLVFQGAPPMREILSLVRNAWSPYTKPCVWAPETIRSARHLVEEIRANVRRDWCDWLALAFELEACMSCIEYSWPLNVTSYGEYNGCWIEVGRLSISKIQSTELVVVRRVLAELVNIRTKGFAPIIVNELGCDTDGTHRLVATWTWNLLHFVGEVKYDVTGEQLVKSVIQFLEIYGRDMGQAVVHESLRSLGEILTNQEMRRVFDEEVLPYVKRYYPVTHLPVLLLPEYSCGAVIKGPYDEGVASYRVDPMVYERIARDRSCVLPARGPYHLTDRALLPWFEVLELR